MSWKIQSSRSGHGTLAAVAAGTALVLVTYVTPMATLPVTSEDVGAGAVARAWILSSMSVGLAGFLLAGGLLGDRLGRRRVYLLGLAGVIVGAGVVAASWNPWVLVGGRLIQGAGGAAVLACGLALLAHAYPTGPNRVRATSVWGASVGGGIAGGSVLAVVLDVGTGWRENYVATAVGGVAILALSMRRIPDSRAQSPRRIDVTGLTLLSSGLILAVCAMTEARTGVGASVVVLATVALLTFGALIIVERRVRQPLIDPDLLRLPRFLATTVGALVLGAGMIGMASFLPTVAQAGFGESLQAASMPPLAWAVTSTVAALSVRRLPFDLHGPGAIAALLALTAFSMLTALWSDSSAGLVVPLALAGISTGWLNAILGRDAVASVPADQAAMASGANNTARYLGASCGITLFAMIATYSGSGIVEGWRNAVVASVILTLAGAFALAIQSLKEPNS
ncbi:MFS transporter [Demetria terragena]|uniref:MFS transporter n=1 Tax=Demetria terragena TaxID=63959 RepID=UPI0012EAFA38|nr:MFS transporter [Demetria terragena]